MALKMCELNLSYQFEAPCNRMTSILSEFNADKMIVSVWKYVSLLFCLSPFNGRIGLHNKMIFVLVYVNSTIANPGTLKIIKHDVFYAKNI
jgi:hypothetical protein